MPNQSVASKNNPDDKLIIVGVISSAHGIKGQVIVKSFTHPVKNIIKLPVFDLNQEAFKLKLIKIQPNGNLICTLENCHNRTEAEQFTKKSLYCFRSSLPEISVEDEFYIEDLKDLKVIDCKGNRIGNIINFVNYGGGDVVEIQFSKNGRSAMLPFTKKLFPEITKHHIVLILPDNYSLLDSN